jgi:glycosyltransferase involved in cell wall biosynthesis
MFPLLHAGNYNWLNGFRGKRKTFKKITDCHFDKNEIIVSAGMWASSQLADLESIPNPKLQYLHGEHIVNPEETNKTLKSKIPKIVVSSYLKPMVESYGGKILGIIPNGINQSEYFNSVDASEKNAIGSIYASHISKDPNTLLAVLEKLSKYKPQVPIRVFSPHRRPLGIKRRSFWRLPSVEKAREIYSRSIVWIIASKSEGFSIPALEAMACGCVVVATKCGGPSDIIRDGENGFLVEVGNVNQIVDKVLLLLNNESLRKQMRLKAEETVKKFNWDETVNRLENVFKIIKP